MTFDGAVVQKNKAAKYVKSVTTNFFLHPNSIKAQHRAASPRFLIFLFDSFLDSVRVG